MSVSYRTTVAVLEGYTTEVRKTYTVSSWSSRRVERIHVDALTYPVDEFANLLMRATNLRVCSRDTFSLPVFSDAHAISSSCQKNVRTSAGPVS